MQDLDYKVREVEKDSSCKKKRRLTSMAWQLLFGHLSCGRSSCRRSLGVDQGLIPKRYCNLGGSKLCANLCVLGDPSRVFKRAAQLLIA